MMGWTPCVNPVSGAENSCSTLCMMVMEPTYRSPPYRCMPLFNTMVTRLSVELMIKGEIPSEKVCPMILGSGFKFFISRRMEDFPLTRKPTFHAALMAWEITVAMAAPRTPQPNTKIKIGSRTILITAPITMESMAVLGFP